jgi:putative addiction module CopG family antidote
MAMEVAFTPDQEAFIRQAIASGRYRSPEDAVRDAMTRWEESERSRLRLLTAFNEAETDLDSGDFTDHTDENESTLAAELKREARALRDRA